MERHGLIVVTVAMAEGAVAWWAPIGLLRYPIAWCAVATAACGIAMTLGVVSLLGKRRDGSMPLWSPLIWWPWHLATRVSAAAGRLRGEPYTEVAPGWYIGGWPETPELFDDWPAVVDTTCELPRRVPDDVPYLNLPTWDGTAPTQDAIAQGAAWATKQREAGPVLVHCTHGHSRSATVLAAALLMSAEADTWQDALAVIRRSRKRAHLTGSQRAALARWAEGFSARPSPR